MRAMWFFHLNVIPALLLVLQLAVDAVKPGEGVAAGRSSPQSLVLAKGMGCYNWVENSVKEVMERLAEWVSITKAVVEPKSNGHFEVMDHFNMHAQEDKTDHEVAYRSQNTFVSCAHHRIAMDQNALDSTEPKLSPLFRDPNADVTFTSSDGVLFKIHRRHLEPTTGGFPVADAMVVGPEPVALPEPADVLEALFQFIQPPTEATNFRQPSVHNMQEDIFFAVAEAAEKYLVYGAMNICVTFMRCAHLL
ncbi:hypothetical protein NLJ89_g5559 [Agrocybe chaxingu]|uniref:BTB domain-containing protein n=1 Tax=Agrocybe chaxingu TaxID=84603 RepID=A0A9W8MVH1_9AGAR|nr:hypothetical protein NLJ89_g5559 [Agrocybe chaxingu]